MNMDKKVSIIFLLVAIVFFVESFRFQGALAHQFPQFTAIIVILGSLLIISEDYLPKPVHKFVSEPVNLFGSQEEEAREKTVEDKSQGEKITPKYTMYLITGYVIFAYFVGFLISSLAFVIVYHKKTEQSKEVIAGSVIAVLLIIYVFTTVLYLPLIEGELINFEIIEGVLTII